MEPFEVMTSESQERMLAIVEPSNLDAVLEIARRWEIRATVIGEVVKHTAARTKATCEISAPGYSREDVDVNILSPSKIPVSYR